MSGQLTFQEVFTELYDEAFNLLVERQRKYGPENIRSQGIYGVLTRLSDDKIARVKQSLQGTIVNGKIDLDPIRDAEATDTFEDALLDIANYALIALSLHRGLWGCPLEEDVEEDFFVEELDDKEGIEI